MPTPVESFRAKVLETLNKLIQDQQVTSSHCRSQCRYQDAAYAEAQERAFRKAVEAITNLPATS